MNFFQYVGKFLRFGNMTGAMSDNSGMQGTDPAVPLLKDTPAMPADAGLQLAAVWCCVNLLAETIASLPLCVYRVDKDGNKTEARDSNLWNVMRRPNALMTAHDFWIAMSLNRHLRGNAYALITRDGAGQLVSLVPLAADQMEVAVQNGSVYYQYIKDGQYTIFNQDQIFHWKGLGNGFVGMSTFDYMRATADELKNAQYNASKLYGNGNQLSGIITMDKVVNSKQLLQLRERFKNLGPFNGDSWLHFIPADMKFQQVGMSAADAQLLESRQFGVEEIGRWFGVPSALLNSSGGAAGTNIETIVESFYRTTINPLCTAIEQALNQKVLTAEEQMEYVCEFKMNALMRANVSARYSSYAQALQNGFMTRNEVRRMENLPAVEGADDLTAQTNLMPVQNLGAGVENQPQTPLGEPIKQ